MKRFDPIPSSPMLAWSLVRKMMLDISAENMKRNTTTKSPARSPPVAVEAQEIQLMEELVSLGNALCGHLARNARGFDADVGQM